MRFLTVGGLLTTFLFAVSGCGQSDRPGVHAARGKVLFKGQPVAHAIVVLHPVETGSKDGVKPRATVAADGTFTLGTYEARDGAPAGKYRATVEWWLSPGPDAPPVNRLPARFGKPETSKLEVEIVAGDNELPPFLLKP